MPKLPAVSGRDIVYALERLGFGQISQRGSHVKMRRGAMLCVVPLHREIKKGTLAGILKQAGVTADELVGALAQ